MTVDEKLNKCIEFIKEIERLPVQNSCTHDCSCNDCGSADIYCNCPSGIDIDFLMTLKDNAWHILADIAD